MLKLVVTIVLFLISLLTILPAPAFYLWLLAIAVDEFSWIFIVVTLLFVVLSSQTKNFQIPALLFSCAALLLFTSPLVRAYAVSKEIRGNLENAFGFQEAINLKPFSIPTLFGSKSENSFSTVSYKKTTSVDLLLDFYPSKLRGKRPCVIVIHGGSWKSGDRKQLPELNNTLAENGYHTAAINYRLAPEFQNPAPVEDVKDAINFLTNHAEEWNIDTTNFILLGRSAGAQIALLAGFTLMDTKIKGIIDFYGPADMVWGYSIPSNPLIMDSRKVMEDYLGGTYNNNPQKFESSSPLRYVNQYSPPTLLIHGKNDVLVAYEHSRRLTAKLEENKIKHYLLTLPWATHAFDYNINGPGGQLSTYAVMYFLKSITKPS